MIHNSKTFKKKLLSYIFCKVAVGANLMTEFRYQLKDGRSVNINVDDFDYAVKVTVNPTGETVGSMNFKVIEISPGNEILLLTHAFLDEAGRTYLGKGIGRCCLQQVADISGLSICASNHDGMKHDDGSHLTGDGLGFVAKMRKEGLIVGTDRQTD